MPVNLASLLLSVILVATIVPPGYPAYIGSYTALVAALLALVVYGLRERAVLNHPSARAILLAILLVTITVPFVYQGPGDLAAPVLILPLLAAIAMGMLARPARPLPGPTVFASICLAGVTIAMCSGIYENFVLGIYRPGMGNNPIHFASLAAMSGGLALVGVVAGKSAWRYLFLLGPVFGIATAIVADSRGPMVGAVALAATGMLLLTVWFWRERAFRWSALAILAVGMVTLLTLSAGGNTRALGMLDSAINIFRFTGGGDDIRAALYISSLHAFAASPIVGHGLGQIMLTAQAMFPEQPQVFTLEHLHADWTDFVVMAGGLGLLAYLALLASPLLLLVDKSVRSDRPVVMGALLLVVGQLTLGISNATFGILPQTTLFAVVLGFLLARARMLKLAASADPAQP